MLLVKTILMMMIVITEIAYSSANTSDTSSSNETKLHRKIIIVALPLSAAHYEQEATVRESFRKSIESFRRRSWNEPIELRHVFFYGHGNFTPAENTNDMLQGDFPDSQNGLKLFQLFKYTSQMQADFLIVMEKSTTVRWSRLKFITRLETPVYIGEIHEHLEFGLKSQVVSCIPECSPMKRKSTDRTFYMNEGFYGLSMDAVRKIVSCKYAAEHVTGRVGIMVADWLVHCNPSILSAHFPQGIIFRFGNVKGHMDRILFNIISENLHPHPDSASETVGPELNRKVVLVAIMMNAQTKTHTRYIRDAFRTSIANFKRRSPAAPFILRHFFFFGLVPGADFSDENATYGDVVVGNFGENMNRGKTFQLFRYASRLDGDYVIKMDDDTTVRWSRLELVARLRPPIYFGQMQESDTYGILGRSNNCRCRHGVCGTPENPWPERCRFFFQGMFYGLSMDAVRLLAVCPWALAHPNWGGEDVCTANQLENCIPDINTAHLPEGLVFRHRNKEQKNEHGKNRTAFNILVEKLETTDEYEKYLASHGGPLPPPSD